MFNISKVIAKLYCKIKVLGQNDRQKDRQTDRPTTIYPPSFDPGA